MSFLLGVKVFGDLCLYGSVAVAVAPWFAVISPLFLPALLCAAGVGLAALLSGRRLGRYLGLAPIAASFALCAHMADVIVVIPMVVYCVYLIFRGRFALDYGRYYDFFTAGLKFLGLAVLFATINMDWLAMLPYACVYLVGGVFLMRQLRLGVGRGWQDKVLNFLALVGVVALGGGACLALYLVMQLRFPASDLVERLLYLVLYLAEVLAVFGDYLSAWLARVLPEGFGFGDHTAIPDLKLPPYEFHVGEEVLPNALVRSIVGVVFVVGLIIASVALVRKMLRILRVQGQSSARQVFVESIPGERKKRRERPGSNRAKVRAFYRKFLVLVRSRGGNIQPSHTSADVLYSAAPVADAEASLAMREVYLPVRYDETRTVTDEDVKRAKELYNKLKEK